MNATLADMVFGAPEGAPRKRLAGGPGDRLSGRGGRIGAQRRDELDLLAGEVPPAVAVGRAHEVSAQATRSAGEAAQGKKRSSALPSGALDPASAQATR